MILFSRICRVYFIIRMNYIQRYDKLVLNKTCLGGNKMEDIYLRYDNGVDGLNLKEFYEYQSIIRKDLERIRYLASDYETSEEREELFSNLDKAINNICNNRFPDDPLMQLEILVQGNYLVFSYFQLQEDENPLTSEPTFVIITREMRNLYFIDKVCTITENEEAQYVGLDNPYQNYNRYVADCYQLGKDAIVKHNINFEGNTPIYECFQETDKMIEKIKSKF